MPCRRLAEAGLARERLRQTSFGQSAAIRCESLAKRADSASNWPFSQISDWPSQARSVVDSPWPADE
jgi:hypothetical protein